MNTIRIVAAETTYRSTSALFRKYTLSNGAEITIEKITTNGHSKIYIVPELTDNFSHKFEIVWDGCYYVKNMVDKYLPWGYMAEFSL